MKKFVIVAVVAALAVATAACGKTRKRSTKCDGQPVGTVQIGQR